MSTGLGEVRIKPTRSCTSPDFVLAPASEGDKGHLVAPCPCADRWCKLIAGESWQTNVEHRIVWAQLAGTLHGLGGFVATCTSISIHPKNRSYPARSSAGGGVGKVMLPTMRWQI